MLATLESFQKPAPGGADRTVTSWRLIFPGTGEIMESDSPSLLAGKLLDRTLAIEFGSRDDVVPYLQAQLGDAAAQLAAVISARGAL
jgi:hypothetical protein